MRGKYVKSVGLATLCLGFLAAAPQTKAATELLNVTNSTWLYYTNGIDQGTAWKETGFVVTADWQSGKGLFGLEPSSGVTYDSAAAPLPGELVSGGTRFNTLWPSQASVGTAYVTIYARSTFDWVGSTVGAVLTGILRLDDGIVIYINGVEAYRNNMPAGTILFSTQASAANPGGEPRVLNNVNISAAALIDGPNVIAVEIHQATGTGSGSSDVVFGLDLSGDVAILPTFNNPAEPVNADVLQGRSHTLIGTASGLPAPTYQWFKDGNPLAATGATLTIPFMTAGDGGQYYVEASNTAGTVRSRTAIIDFTQDTQGPTLLSAFFRADGKMEATFDEQMSPIFANYDILNMPVYVTDGDPFFDALGYAEDPDWKSSVVAGYLTNMPPSTVSNTWVYTLSEAPAPGVNYTFLIYTGAAFDQFNNPTSVDNSVEVGSSLTIFEWNSDWKYFQTTPATTDPGFGATFYSDPDFNDSAWPSGPGLHGRESEHNLNSPANTFLPGYSIQTPLLSTGNGGPQQTTYMRKTYTLPFPVANLAQASIQIVYDDGCAVYVNGLEVARRGIPVGATFTASAASHEVTNAVYTFPVSGLVDGPNTFAVELHDSGTGSSDLVFGLQLIGVVSQIQATDPTITDPQPASQTVPEGADVTYSITVTGGFPSPALQWFKDGVALSGETSLTLSLLDVDDGDSGTYTVQADNGSANPAVSAGAVLDVTVDTVRPVLTRAIATIISTNIVLEFSEAIDEELGTNVASYAVALRGGGPNLTIDTATMSGNGTSVTLDTSARLPNQNYSITITGLKDTSLAGNVIDANPTEANVWTEVIVLDTKPEDTWKYFDTFATATTGLDGEPWTTAAYNDTAWETGSPLFYSQRPIGTIEPSAITPLTLLPELSLSNTLNTVQIPAVYFRKSFTFPHNPLTTDVRLRYIVDDGMVAYFNGTEVHRDNMPAGAIVFTTLANGTGAPENFFEPSVGVSSANLTEGPGNQIAVELHQNAAGSSDFAFALQVLRLVETVTAAPLITDVSVNASGNLIITFTGNNVYVQKAANLNDPNNPASWTTVSGLFPSGGTFDAGPVSSAVQSYLRLTDTP